MSGFARSVLALALILVLFLPLSRSMRADDMAGEGARAVPGEAKMRTNSGIYWPTHGIVPDIVDGTRDLKSLMRRFED